MKIVGTMGRMWADTIYSPTVDSLVEMMQVSERTLCQPGEMILYNKAAVSYHELGRGQLVDEMEGEWLLQVDTDHSFAPDLLIRLLEIQKKHHAPVVSAIYQFKHPPHSPVAGLWTGDKTLTPLLDWDRSAEVIQVGACGAGALLVRKEVFKRIKEELREAPFAITEGLSEDYSFCRRCRTLGIPVVLAPQVEAHHIVRSTLHIGDYRCQQETKPAKTQGGAIV